MKKSTLALAASVAVAVCLPTAAMADGKIRCGGGPRDGWTDVEQLKQKLLGEGWTIKKAKKVRDCYEVYGKTPEGDNVESFFHPVSLKKILVLKRGRELYRAPGY